MQRRHDIDALRAIAFATLMVYHLAMLYVFDWDWHLKSSYQSDALQWPMLFLNRWRMDLIFLISGISAAFLLHRSRSGREFARFLRQRSARLLWPLLFGIAVVVTIQPYCQGVANGLVEPGFLRFLGRYYSGYPWPAKAFDGWQYGFTWNHLWYLAYLWCYTVLLVLLQPVFATPTLRKVEQAFTQLRGARLLLWPAMPLLLFTALLLTRFPQTHDLTHDWYAHTVYFTMFIYGWWLGRSEALWVELARLRKVSGVAALLLFAAYLLALKNQSENLPPWELLAIFVFRSLYIWCALCAVLGWGHALLNRPFRWLPWANEAVFPWYMLHQSLIVLLAYWLVPLKLGPVAEPLLVASGTVAGCWALTAVIRRSRWLRPAFGLKNPPPPAIDLTPASARMPQA
jgi:peptidoglycan/LPS O-acetylase OafA/YrhL